MKNSANGVQNEFHAPWAHILFNEVECAFADPKLESLEVALEVDGTVIKTSKETENEEKKLKQQISQEEHEKEVNVHKKNKEKLCGYLKKNCMPMMIMKQEVESKCDKNSLEDPV